MTWRELVKDEAAKLGFVLTDADAECALWEYTGYPEFWAIPTDGATPEECCRKQIREFFATATGGLDAQELHRTQPRALGQKQ